MDTDEQPAPARWDRVTARLGGTKRADKALGAAGEKRRKSIRVTDPSLRAPMANLDTVYSTQPTAGKTGRLPGSRLGLAVISTALLSLAALLLAFSPPYKFEASERLLAVSSDAHLGFSRPTVRPLSRDHLVRAWETVTARDSLAGMIVAYDLFPGDPLPDQEAQVRQLRNALKMDLTQTESDRATAVIVSARMNGARAARDIAQELSHRMVQEIARHRILQAENLREFARSREVRLARELKRLTTSVKLIDSQVDGVSAEGAELEQLRREMAMMEHQLDLAMSQRIEAAAAVALERRRLGDRLVVVDPAFVPQKFAAPKNRFLIAGLGLAAVWIFGLLALIFRRRQNARATMS